MKIYIITLFAFIMSIPVIIAQDGVEAEGSILEKLENKRLSDEVLKVYNSEVTNKDARFSRPALFKQESDKGSFSIGGYTAANSQYFVTDGEGEGLHFQFRNINFYGQSSFHNDKIQFITNVGFDPSTNQFHIEEAAMNIKFHSAFNLRGGIILPPLGYFNQNGDAPTSDFIDFPLSSTTIIPSRFSDVGFGATGYIDLHKQFVLTYELYAVNGLQNEIIDNDLPRTAINLGTSTNVFRADNNDKLSYTGRVGVHLKALGELGFSYYGGAYNTTLIDETEIDDSRKLSIMALDGQFAIANVSVKGEFVLANIDVYEGLGQLFGSKQIGYHVEASYPILSQIQLLGNPNNQLNLALRYEKADYNVGLFEQTSTNIFDDITYLRVGLALRLGSKSVVKANYTYMWEKDILGNSAKTGGIQFGMATYF